MTQLHHLRSRDVCQDGWGEVTDQEFQRWLALFPSRKEAYAAFLKTKFWLTISLRAKERDYFMCQRCQESKTILQAHHVRYPENWFTTDLGDLITLCGDCHEAQHGVKLSPLKLNAQERYTLKMQARRERHRHRMAKLKKNVSKPVSSKTRQWLWMKRSKVNEVNEARLAAAYYGRYHL